jgi:hypothetical protein
MEMAMDEEAWNSLASIRGIEPDFPELQHTGSSRQQQTSELTKNYNTEPSHDPRIVGIKVICEGIIDAFTAYLS